MDNVTVIWVATLVGALMGTIVPYALKAYQDTTMKFDMNYAYALIVGVIVQSVTLIPDVVPDLSLKIVVLAFAAGYGVQTIINKATPRSDK